MTTSEMTLAKIEIIRSRIAGEITSSLIYMARRIGRRELDKRRWSSLTSCVRDDIMCDAELKLSRCVLRIDTRNPVAYIQMAYRSCAFDRIKSIHRRLNHEEARDNIDEIAGGCNPVFILMAFEELEALEG